MADLGYTNAEWKRFLRGSILPPLRRWRELENLRRRFTRERTQIRVLNDTKSSTPHITALTLSGVDYGVNTSDAGKLYVRWVANASNWDVHLYTATGASGEVARATNVAASATGTLAAQNSSGLTGSITLGANITADTSDDHILVVECDYKLESTMLWPSDGTYDDDAASRDAWSRANADQARAIEAMQARELQLADELLLSAADNPKAFGNFFLSAQEQARLSITVSVDQSTGAVSRINRGLLPILFSAMNDETTGSTQDVVERVVDAGTVSFDSNNDGSGTMADHTPEEHCPIGTWYFECVAGHNDGPEIAGKERFSVRFAAADSDEDYADEDFRELTVGQSYKGPLGFGAVTLARSLTKSNDGSNTKAGAASTFTFTGENGFNTASGVVYGKVVDAGGSTYDYEFYSSSAGRSAGNTHGDLVAKVTGIAASTTTQATSRNGSGLTIDFDTGSSPSDGDTFDIDLNFFSSQNSNNAPDKFQLATTLTSEGRIQALMSLMFRYKLPGDTSGSEQVSDDLVLVNVPLDYITVDV